MSDVIDKYLEIAVSIFIYVSCAVLTVSLLICCQDPIVTLTNDKTFVESEGVQQLEEHKTYGSDLLAMLINVDIMSPYPKAIKINNTPVIRMDNEFLAYKMRNVGSIYSSGGQHKLSLMLDYVVTSTRYVYKGADAPYIEYILEVR